MGTYGWQIHIPDSAELLQAMGPALETRLSASPFAGWSGPFLISFYTSALLLTIDNGRLLSVDNVTPPSDAKIRMPFSAFVPLVLGYRSADEIREQYPDFGADGSWKLILETLFPKRESFIFTAY